MRRLLTTLILAAAASLPASAQTPAIDALTSKTQGTSNTQATGKARAQPAMSGKFQMAACGCEDDHSSREWSGTKQ